MPLLFGSANDKVCFMQEKMQSDSRKERVIFHRKAKCTKTKNHAEKNRKSRKRGEKVFHNKSHEK